jgi:hypothetical protein
MELIALSRVLLRIHGVVIFLWIYQVVLRHHVLDLSFALWFGGTFHFLLIRRSKVLLLLFEFLLNLGITPICRTK